jgi:hypothetical protein
MSPLIYVSAAALFVVIIMVFVTSRRVTQLRDDVDNRPPPPRSTVKDTSLATSKDGVVVPKTYYWVELIRTESTNSNLTTTFKLETNNKNDNQNLMSDISNNRITYIYRPEKNYAYNVDADLENNLIKVTKSPNSPEFIALDQVESLKCTLVGLPQDVLN